jgi:uncharacterized protein YcfJ
MKRTLTASLLVLAIAFAPGAAIAKGCIKGALVGGVAGHTTGHGAFTGAVLGCITGRTVAKGQKMRQEQARRAQEQARRAQPTQVGTAAAPARLHSKTEYMYVWPHRSHTHKIAPEGRSTTGQ